MKKITKNGAKKKIDDIIDSHIGREMRELGRPVGNCACRSRLYKLVNQIFYQKTKR